MRTAMAAAGGVAVVVLACAGCGQQRLTQTQPHAANALIAPQSAATLGARRVFKNAGVTLDPPGLERAAVGLDKAFARCAEGDAVCPPGVAPMTLLALASSDSTGTALPNGRVQPSLSKRLVYAFHWDSQPCVRAGGPPETRPTPTSQTCTYLSLVDAKTGEMVYSVVSPGP